jgi:hypothetical protein
MDRQQEELQRAQEERSRAVQASLTQSSQDERLAQLLLLQQQPATNAAQHHAALSLQAPAFNGLLPSDLLRLQQAQLLRSLTQAQSSLREAPHAAQPHLPNLQLPTSVGHFPHVDMNATLSALLQTANHQQINQALFRSQSSLTNESLLLSNLLQAGNAAAVPSYTALATQSHGYPGVSPQLLSLLQQQPPPAAATFGQPTLSAALSYELSSLLRPPATDNTAQEALMRLARTGTGAAPGGQVTSLPSPSGIPIAPTLTGLTRGQSDPAIPTPSTSEISDEVLEGTAPLRPAAATPAPVAALPSANVAREGEDEGEVAGTSRPSSGKKKALSFATKLFDMITDAEKEGNDSIVSFTATGRAFRIHQKDELMKELVPRYFRRQKKFCSFRRQLSMYGFERVPFGPDEGAFANRFFVRGNRVMVVQNMKREKRGSWTERPTFEVDYSADWTEGNPMNKK